MAKISVAGAKRLAVAASKRLAVLGTGGGGGGGGGYPHFGIKPDGKRDPLQWPAAVSSFWNTPIGTGAAMSAAGISFGVREGYYTRLTYEEEYIFMDPAESGSCIVRYSDAGWTGVNRCAPSGSSGAFPITVKMPSGYVIPDSQFNNPASWINAAGTYVSQAQPFTRCVAANDGTALVKFGDEDITGECAYGAHGGSHLSGFAGCIRKGALTNALDNGIPYLPHCLKVLFQAKYFWAWNGGGGAEYHSPATTADGYADGTTYGGSVAAVGPGALLVLPPAFNTAALRTPIGRLLGLTCKYFGAYCVDDGGDFNAGYMFAIEKGPAGNVTDEYTTLTSGGSWFQDPADYASGSDWFKDMADIAAGFYVVTNNSISNKGGGGSSLYGVPAAPGF